MFKINVPATVLPKNKIKYFKNYKLATQKTGRLNLFAADQKIEHLNNDFWGEKISKDDAHPEHFFKIAKQAKVGILAGQLGLIANYGLDYPEIPYLIKLNSKTNLVGTEIQDPLSKAINTVEQVVEMAKNSKLKIVGVGYTIYLGSKFESEMLTEAEQIIYQAHQNGLLAVLWIYPRGQAIDNEKDSHLIAGATGVACSLGSDFVKVSYPKKANKETIKEIIQAAGRTGVIFSGGSAVNPKLFLKRLEKQISYGARGNATGRNIHQLSLPQAIKMARAIKAISLSNHSALEAYRIYQGKKSFNK